MSGHSKWKNIMHKKEKTDAQRAKVFTKIGKEIAIAVRDGVQSLLPTLAFATLLQRQRVLMFPTTILKELSKKLPAQTALLMKL